MRNPVNVLESLKSKSCNFEYGYERLYRNLYNPEFFLLAYQNIYAKEGNLTAGTDGLTIDGMSAKRIDALIASLRDFSYQPNPARRSYIAKNGAPQKKRPLGIPSFNDKLVQEVVRMILESIYEDTFSRHSHGFRPYRSCHTALMEVKKEFTGVKWFVEGDIKGCFDNIDHHILVNILRRRIKDERFIELIWKFLKAGYIEDWVYHNTYSGTPQGSIISPVLANVYLNELDIYMAEYAERFNRGKYRKHRKAYHDKMNGFRRAQSKYRKADWNAMTEEEKKTALKEIKTARADVMSEECGNPMDASFRRVAYTRYADDFLIGVIGSKEDAETLKRDVGAFLKDSLNLELSEEKTLVTHAKDKARFLGFDVFSCDTVTPKRDKRGFTRRSKSGRIMLYVPKEKWMSRLFAYGALKIHYDANRKEIWTPVHRNRLLHLDDLEILKQYNAEVRGLYNYYKIAGNVSVLNNFNYVMKFSMFKTFAAKYNSSIGKIRDKYRMGADFGVRYETKKGWNTLLYYNGGFRHTDTVAKANVDSLPNTYFRTSPNSLIARLKARKCEWCGAEDVDLEIHHVRKLKNLKGRAAWERAMIGRKRKTMALCVSCHDLLHAGKLD